MTALKDSAYLDAELFAAVFTLPKPFTGRPLGFGLGFNAVMLIDRAAMRAYRFPVPTQVLKELPRGILIAERNSLIPV